MAEKKQKKGLPLWVFGLVATILAIVAVMIFVPVDNVYGGEHWGWAAGTWWFWKSFLFEVRSAFRGDAIAQGILYFTVAASIFMTVMCLTRKEPKKLLNVAILLFAGFVTSYVIVVLSVGIEHGWAGRKAMVGLTGGATLGIIALLLLFFDAMNSGILPVKQTQEEKENEEREEEWKIRDIVRDELAKQEQKDSISEERVGEIVDEKALNEEEVREIVRDELGKREPEEKVEEPEEEPAPAPVVEEAVEEVVEEPEEEPEEEAEEEPEAEEAVEVAAGAEAGDSKFPNSKRRGASFETKLKNSEYDLRHKYYDLRDYIKSYGINNRISRPGDTFSLHRERLVFLTISGKHIKASFALNPEDYKDTAIPVDVNTSKKFEGLPLAFKVKSDLSFRRAKKLVDDLMAIKGYTKDE